MAGGNRVLFIVDGGLDAELHDTPYALLFAAERRVRTITFLNVHNPNTVSEVIILRWVIPVVKRDTGLVRKHSNEFTIRFRKTSIAASGDFTFGTMGGRIPLYPPGQRFELVAVSTLTLPLEVYLTFDDVPHAANKTIDPITGEYDPVHFTEDLRKRRPRGGTGGTSIFGDGDGGGGGGGFGGGGGGGDPGGGGDTGGGGGGLGPG